jgi:hypothetical protein
MTNRHPPSGITKSTQDWDATSDSVKTMVYTLMATIDELQRATVSGLDRFSAYNWLDSSRRQLYWAHLLHDFRAFVEREGKSAMACPWREQGWSGLPTKTGDKHDPRWLYD